MARAKWSIKTGDRFNRLVAVHDAAAAQVKYGGIKSCGCLFRQKIAEPRAGKHKMIETPEYRIWVGMRRRCAKASENPRHGGRGIRVCERWSEFANFYADMGARPSRQHTVDRIDNDGDYEPSNCRWATAKEQALNRHNSIYVTVGGKDVSLTGLAEMHGISYRTLYWRFKNNRPLLISAR
jgi:hypothetical protein